MIVWRIIDFFKTVLESEDNFSSKKENKRGRKRKRNSGFKNGYF
jgi:hypothetical protein